MVALLFPGQGSQYVGMGYDLYEEFDIAKQIFDTANDILGVDIKRLCFHGPDDELKLTYNTQPAILTVSYILYLLVKDKLNPSYCAGHSLGEYTANLVAETITFEKCLKLVRKRGELMHKATEMTSGCMYAIIGLDKEKVNQICNNLQNEGIVSIANYNSVEQVVISGEEEVTVRCANLCKDAGAKRVIKLEVSAPFHCRLMKQAEEQFVNYLDEIEFQHPRLPLVCNLTAEVVNKREEVKEVLKKQISNPVLWEDSIKTLHKLGCRKFIEVGPGKVLSGLVKRIIKDVEVMNISDKEGVNKFVTGSE